MASMSTVDRARPASTHAMLMTATAAFVFTRGLLWKAAGPRAGAYRRRRDPRMNMSGNERTEGGAGMVTIQGTTTWWSLS